MGRSRPSSMYKMRFMGGLVTTTRTGKQQTEERIRSRVTHSDSSRITTKPSQLWLMVNVVHLKFGPQFSLAHQFTSFVNSGYSVDLTPTVWEGFVVILDKSECVTLDRILSSACCFPVRVVVTNPPMKRILYMEDGRLLPM